MTELQTSNSNVAPQTRQELSGRSLVVGMLCLGIVTTVLMFVYWDQHTRPYRSLREAIGREFLHSRPNVEGGRSKGTGPRTLRVSMSVDFSPAEDSTQANNISEQVWKILGQYQDVKAFDIIELVLIQFVPQELAKTRTFKWAADGARINDEQ